MSRKNHNSVLFLTTLGVYLGLVLVGATPQVLAQAATTKQFIVRELAGARDDLDNKPDDERSSLSSSVQLYLDDLEIFIAALGDLNRRGRFDLLTDTFDVTQTALMPCVSPNTGGRYTPVKFESSSESSRDALTRVSNAMTSGYALGDCVVTAFNGQAAVDSRFNVRLDQKELSVSVVVVKHSSQHAHSLASDIDTLNALFRSDLESPVRTAILANTLVRPIAEHTVIVTRLPRGSLLPLLASNAQ